MIIQCDTCSARFRLDDSRVTENGVKVRCKRCQHIFLVRREPAVTPPEQEIPPFGAGAEISPPPAPSRQEDAAAPWSLSPAAGESGAAGGPPPTGTPETAGAGTAFGEAFPAEEDVSAPVAPPDSVPEQPAPPPPAAAPLPAGEPAAVESAPAPPPGGPEPPAAVPGAEAGLLPPPLPVSRRQGPAPATLFVLLLAGLIVLIVGGAVALSLLKGPGYLEAIGLGSVARLLGATETVPERIRLTKLEGSYVTNGEAGELFVIRGEAVNTFRTSRAAIQVTGVIYNAAGAVLLQQGTYCGNPLSPEQLATLPLAKIRETMTNRLGDSYANIGVPPGKSVPFVIVFAGLPKDAADYGVEVAGSQAAGE